METGNPRTELRLKPPRKAGACRHFVADNPPGFAVVALGGTRRPGRTTGFPVRRSGHAGTEAKWLLKIVACALGQGRRRATPAPPGSTAANSRTGARRRARLPKEAMSEGAHHRQSCASLRLRLSAQRRSGTPYRGRAGACRRREAGPTPGRIALTGLDPSRREGSAHSRRGHSLKRSRGAGRAPGRLRRRRGRPRRRRSLRGRGPRTPPASERARTRRGRGPLPPGRGPPCRRRPPGSE